jgi:hypothetical protein
MRGNIGFVVTQYHTELLDFLFELVHTKYNIILYIEDDDYNNLTFLRRKFKFIQKSFLNYFIEDYQNEVCFKYINLSHLDLIVKNIKEYKLNNNKILFLVHTLEEMTLLKNSFSDFNYFIVSNQLKGDLMTPISNFPYIGLNDHHKMYNDLYEKLGPNKKINIIKIGWMNDIDSNIYDKILSLKNVQLTIFTRRLTDDLEKLISKYKNIHVQYEKTTEYIYDYICSNNIKFVLHVPNSIGIWSGSISFALNNNLILLTNDEAISNYNIPNEYCLSYRLNGKDLQTELNSKYLIDTRDENILRLYRNKISMENLSVLEKKLQVNNNDNIYLELNNKKIDVNGHAYQDLFVLFANDFKKSGYFVEIGSAWPKHTNNTYILEKHFDWRGIMVEYDNNYLESYITERPNSIHVIKDATKIDYLELFKTNNVPEIVDYLQIDLEVDNESTLKVIKLFDKYIFDKYKFATITFEHDFYRGDFYDTRYISRQILHKRGYVLLFPDVGIGIDTNFSSFEDWWVHPDLVDDEFIKKHYNNTNSITCHQIIKKMF